MDIRHKDKETGDVSAKARYGDILDHPYPFPMRHARMKPEDRAAQFASFAALNGYEEAVEEEARLTEREVVLDDSVREEINQTLVEAEECLRQGKPVRLSVTWFQPDARKEGGAYRTTRGRLKKIDHYRQALWMTEMKETKSETSDETKMDENTQEWSGKMSIGFQQICGIEILD